jgi:integrase
MRSSKASANRALTLLKAALRQAYLDDLVVSDRAWRAVRPFTNLNRPRLRFFDKSEIVRLLNAAGTGDFGRLCRAALHSGARFGELTRLRCGDFEPATGTVCIAESKSGKSRRVHLADEGIQFFEQLIIGRAPDTLMLTRDGGGPWTPTSQTAFMNKAMAAARVEGASFHCWRKSHASHAVMNGVPLQVVSANLGHASVQITESTYAHLSPSFRSEQMKKVPAFGASEPSTVVPLRLEK